MVVSKRDYKLDHPQKTERGKQLLILFSLITLFGFQAHAAKSSTTVTGKKAHLLYDLGNMGISDTDEDVEPEVTEFFGGCFYGKEYGKFTLHYCNFSDGFLRGSIQKDLSKLLLSMSSPSLIDEEEGEYAISIHSVCTKSPKYTCKTESIADYDKRMEQEKAHAK